MHNNYSGLILMGLASCVSCQQKYEKKKYTLLLLQESLLDFCFVSVLVPMQGTAAAVRSLRGRRYTVGPTRL